MPIREVRAPIVLIIHSDRDFSLADQFKAELDLLNESGIIRVWSWFIADRYVNQEENRRNLINRLDAANVVLLLTSQNLLRSAYYQQILIPQIRDLQNNEEKTLLPIILSPLNLDYLEGLGELQSRRNRRLIFPSDGRSIFGEHLPEEMNGVFAEIIENVISELITKFYRPSGVHVAKKKNVFISYSRADYKIANAIRAFLSGQGYTTWMDKYNINVGQNWVKAIDDGIRDSWAMVLLLSHASKSSEYVTYEWSFAFGTKTCVVPLMIENINLHSRLSWINCLNWYHLNVSQYVWDDLIDALDVAQVNASNGTCNT